MKTWQSVRDVRYGITGTVWIFPLKYSVVRMFHGSVNHVKAVSGALHVYSVHQCTMESCENVPLLLLVKIMCSNVNEAPWNALLEPHY